MCVVLRLFDAVVGVLGIFISLTTGARKRHNDDSLIDAVLFSHFTRHSFFLVRADVLVICGKLAVIHFHKIESH